MTEALLVSNAVLWVLVVVLACVVAALVRQMGVLYERVAPAGALVLGHGPAVGEAPAPVSALALDGDPITVGGPAPDGRSTLLFFLSPTCPVCKTLLPAVRSLARDERRRLRVVLAADGVRAEHEAFARAHGLEAFAWALSPTLGLTYRIPKLPYAVLLDGAGVIRSKGLVNSREHLESLLEADERGVASLQDFLQTGAG